MKHRYILAANVLAALLFATAATAMAGPDAIFGTWMRGDGAAKVSMEPCGSDICAINVWIKDPAKQNEKVGDRLIFKIKQEEAGWTGSAYDPQRGLNLSANLKASGNSMVTRGCVLGGMICRSTKWTRN